jgi:hypothetical protein
LENVSWSLKRSPNSDWSKKKNKSFCLCEPNEFIIYYPVEPTLIGNSHSCDFPFWTCLYTIIPSQQTSTPPGPSGNPGTNLLI